MTPLLAARHRATERSFERLYRTHVHAVYRYALAVLHNEADAEDVTQTTFLNAYRAYDRGERPHTPHNWLIKIAHNVCRQRFRDSSRRPREVELNDSLTPAAAEDENVPSATDIRRALGVLGFNQRAALVMRELEGRSYAEIADVLDLSTSAVETLMFRARRALREQLEGGLTCNETEQTLSLLETRKLSTAERRSVRAHLRECKDCATLERRQRAQRAAFERLGLVPLPASLASFIGGGATGGATAGGIGLGAKIATVLAAGLVVTGVGSEPMKARATDDAAPTTSQGVRVTPAVRPGTQGVPLKQTRQTKRDRAVRKQSAKKKASRSARRSASAPTPQQPPAAPARPPSGQQSTGGSQPGVKLRLPLPPPPPPIQLPDLPVKVPPLPPPPELPEIKLPPLPPPPLPPPPLH